MAALLQAADWVWLSVALLLVLAMGLALGLGLGLRWMRPLAPPPRLPDVREVVSGFVASPFALALWDAEGRLLGCNRRFDALFPGPPPPPAPAEVELPDGRWFMAGETRLAGGARLGLYAEVTALKRPPAATPPAPASLCLPVPSTAPLPSPLAAPASGPLGPPELPLAPGGRLRLLGVDDSPANLSVLRALLSNTGFTLETVTDGRAALEALAAAARAGTPFDAVLMDVMMPGMDGLECTRRIRALPPPLGLVPVIPVTASSFPEDVAACHAAGMTGHVPKPVERVGLMRGIALALRRGDSPEEEALRPLFLHELANRMHELERALAEGRPLLAPVHAIAGTVGHLGGATLVAEARAAMRALREEDEAARGRVETLLTRLRAAYPVG